MFQTFGSYCQAVGQMPRPPYEHLFTCLCVRLCISVVEDFLGGGISGVKREEVGMISIPPFAVRVL